MSNNIDTRTSFFPNSRTRSRQKSAAMEKSLMRNDSPRSDQLKKMASKNTKISIPDAVRDFSRIKKTVDAAPEVDNSSKIADLKARIAKGDYSMDYDAMAEKMLQSEF